MITDKELAAGYRRAAKKVREYGWFTPADQLDDEADELDPPKPEFPDGTVAWVDVKPNWHQVMIRANGKWRSDPDAGGVYDDQVTKVEPLRVLANDEIAIKRIDRLDDDGAEDNRNYARHLKGCGHTVAADLVSAYADACDAEAGDR